MQWAASLRRELSDRNRQAAIREDLARELTSGDTPSVIFDLDTTGRHGNFHPLSYRNICADPRWARRLRKVHTASRTVSPGTDLAKMKLSTDQPPEVVRAMLLHTGVGASPPRWSSARPL
jgi:hypothetical protein